jgi:hypothetical protein
MIIIGVSCNILLQHHQVMKQMEICTNFISPEYGMGSNENNKYYHLLKVFVNIVNVFIAIIKINHLLFYVQIFNKIK